MCSRRVLIALKRLLGMLAALVAASVAFVNSAWAADAQLTVADGVVVKFGVSVDGTASGAGLLVREQLRTGAGVVFTSERDDQTGIALRPVPSSAGPRKGDWVGLLLSESAAPANVNINGLTLRFAGGGAEDYPNVTNADAALSMRGGAYMFSGLRIEKNTTGIRILGAGTPQITASKIIDNDSGVVTGEGATPVISLSSLADNRFNGVYNDTPQAVVQAARNWWGHVTGPLDYAGNPAGQGSRVRGDVVYQPYLTSEPAAAQGPHLDVTFDGQKVAADAIFQKAGELVLSAFSAQGVSSLEAYIDNAKVLDQSFGSTPAPSTEASPAIARSFLGFQNLANGSHVLLAVAKDPLGVATTASLSFTLDLKAPGAPVITSPASGSTITSPSVGIRGTAEPGVQIQLFLNGRAVGATYDTDANGNFAASLQLPGEGTHTLQARASNARGEGPLSAAVQVTVVLPSPSITFVSPADQAVVKGTVPVQVSAVDPSGIAQVQLSAESANGTLTALGSLTSAPWSMDWNSASLQDGNYTLIAIATGNAGKSAQARRAIQVQQTPPPPPVPPLPYGARGIAVTPAVSFGDQPIILSGQAVTQDVAAQPVPNATLRLALRVQGFERRITLVSDGAGQFSYSFVPQANDAGTYSVYVVHPDDTQYAARPAPAQFTINRLSFNYSSARLNAIRGQSTPLELVARASAGTGATGVRWQVIAADQPSGSLPPGVSMDVGQPVDVPAGTSVPMTLRLTGSAIAGATGTIVLKAFASESGSRPRAELRVDYELHDPVPGLSPSPSFVEMGVRQGGSASAGVTVTNRGLALARNVRARLLTPQGATPPAWMRLVSSGDVGDLDVGQAVPLQLTAQPGADVADGYYQYQLRIGADNDAGGAVPITVAVAQSGQGGVRFKVVDIYTNTLNASGQPIPGVAGASVKLQNEALTGDIRALVTNDQGLAELTDLPPGNYRWRASAAQHVDASGRIQVRSGLTASERVFLDSQLVSIEFSVTETTIRDEYHVTLEATYQTQVPAPVVLLEPLSINLPDMQIGEEITGELTLSNYGLVRADELQFALPQSDASYRYEFFGDMPAELAAKSRVVIPYRVTALAPVKRNSVSTARGGGSELPWFTGYSPSLQVQHAIRHLVSTGSSPAVPAAQAKAVAKAASCSSYVSTACVGYSYTCAAGDKRQSAACTSISRLSGASCAGGSGGGIYLPVPERPSGWDGSGHGSYGGGGGAPIGLVPACVPVCPDCSGGTGPGGSGGGGGGSGPGPGGGPSAGPGGSSPGFGSSGF